MEEKKYLEPLNVTPSEFPADPELPEGCIEISLEDEPLGIIYHSDIVYAEHDGMQLHMNIHQPSTCVADNNMRISDGKKYPLVVCIIGSAWFEQERFRFVDEYCAFAKRGYVVASVQYRPSTLRPFPAQIEDVKTAMRYLKAHADEYCIDVDKTVYWGGSSGAHTAVMCGITGDDFAANADFPGISASANAIVDWYGPTAIEWMSCYPSTQDHTAPESPEGMVIGGYNVWERTDLAKKIDPAEYLSADKQIPPIYMMHGDKDVLVPFNQSVRFYKKLRELDKDVVFYKLKGASHGYNGFRSLKAYDMVDAFIREKLGL